MNNDKLRDRLEVHLELDAKKAVAPWIFRGNPFCNSLVVFYNAYLKMFVVENDGILSQELPASGP